LAGFVYVAAEKSTARVWFFRSIRVCPAIGQTNIVNAQIVRNRSLAIAGTPVFPFRATPGLYPPFGRNVPRTLYPTSKLPPPVPSHPGVPQITEKIN
jgi:hypothetical protein